MIVLTESAYRPEAPRPARYGWALLAMIAASWGVVALLLWIAGVLS